MARRNEDQAASWTNASVTEIPEPLITYRSGLVTYEESLVGGRFVGRGWNGAGLVNFYDGRLPPGNDEMTHAFRLEMDGQLLTSPLKVECAPTNTSTVLVLPTTTEMFPAVTLPTSALAVDDTYTPT